MIINKFSLKWMLAIAVAIPAIALLFVAFTSLNTMSVMQAQSNSLYANTAAPMRAMAEATSRIPRMRVGIDMMLLQETALKDAKGPQTSRRGKNRRYPRNASSNASCG